MRGRVLTAIAVALLLGACTQSDESVTAPAEPPVALAKVTSAEFVGNAACGDCHAAEVAEWQGSHHQLSMQVASEQTVLGDFADAVHEKDGVTTRFYRDGDRFMVNTQGADGNYADFEVQYTFGYAPLQQYLIPLADGRLQAFSVAWDTRPQTAGGQRWFHLYQDEAISYDDELHWTAGGQNWNFMCAECHSTAFEKRYDPTQKVYASHWSEVNVSCEACHGPASGHLEWTRSREPTENSGFIISLAFSFAWEFANDAATVSRTAPPERTEVETCGVCHARSAKLIEPYQHGEPLHDSHVVSLLRDGLYHADGQIDDEVFVYGSFLQSRMYQQGVTCSDCHNPHTLELRAEGDGTCLQCHAPDKFAVVEHHDHEPGGAGSRCVDCHMPAKIYMVVDPRRDHSFRIPRPDLSELLGTPNACTLCHDDQSNRSAAKAISDWYLSPQPGYQRYAATLAAARTGSREAVPGLLKLVADTNQPAIARATALSHLGAWLDEQVLAGVDQALTDESAMVRTAALSALDPAPVQIRAARAGRLASDPVRSVRNEAGRLLADVPDEAIAAEALPAVRRAREEYVATQLLNADRPEAQLNLANFYSLAGDSSAAEAAYTEALRLNDNFAPGYFGLGLQKVRAGEPDEVLQLLGKAAALAPGNLQYGFTYGIALHDLGQPERSITVLEELLAQHPGNPQLIAALAQYTAELGRNDQAQRYQRMLRPN